MTETDLRLLVLHADDNVLICRQPVHAGETIQVEGQPCTADLDLSLGDKVARRDLEKGAKILRYGVPIGSATRAINRGAHVHLHNMQSDYIPPTLRGELEEPR